MSAGLVPPPTANGSSRAGSSALNACSTTTTGTIGTHGINGVSVAGFSFDAFNTEDPELLLHNLVGGDNPDVTNDLLDDDLFGSGSSPIVGSAGTGHATSATTGVPAEMSGCIDSSTGDDEEGTTYTGGKTPPDSPLEGIDGIVMVSGASPGDEEEHPMDTASVTNSSSSSSSTTSTTSTTTPSSSSKEKAVGSAPGKKPRVPRALCRSTRNVFARMKKSKAPAATAAAGAAAAPAQKRAAPRSGSSSSSNGHTDDAPHKKRRRKAAPEHTPKRSYPPTCPPRGPLPAHTVTVADDDSSDESMARNGDAGEELDHNEFMQGLAKFTAYKNEAMQKMVDRHGLDKTIDTLGSRKFTVTARELPQLLAAAWMVMPVGAYNVPAYQGDPPTRGSCRDDESPLWRFIFQSAAHHRVKSFADIGENAEDSDLDDI